LTPSSTGVSLVCDDTEDTDQKLTDSETEQASDKDLSPAKLGDQPPAEYRSDKSSTVKTDRH
jgi:hypothetical protein